MVRPILRARLEEAYESWYRESVGNSVVDPLLWGVSIFEGSQESRGLAREQGNREMNLEFVIGGIIVVLMLVYLMYALLKPERF